MVTQAVLRAPGEVLGRVRRDVERNALRARNGIKVVTGAGKPQSGLTPKDVVWQRDRAVMWRYRSDKVVHAPPLLIVFSLVSQSYILDLTPGNSFVEHLRDDGFDVYLVDWGGRRRAMPTTGWRTTPSATSRTPSTRCVVRAAVRTSPSSATASAECSRCSRRRRTPTCHWPASPRSPHPVDYSDGWRCSPTP